MHLKRNEKSFVRLIKNSKDKQIDISSTNRINYNFFQKVLTSYLAQLKNLFSKSLFPNIYFTRSRLRISNGRFYADSCCPETVTEPAMRLFQHLALDKNRLVINSSSVTARSIASSTISIILFFSLTNIANSALLFSASLQNGNYNGGFIVDTFSACSDADGSSCGDGDLSNIGISNTPNGVNYTSNNAVINYSIGRDYSSSVQSSFRTQGTVSVKFKADLQNHVNGQPFTDNYGFNQFAAGQATFGAGISRALGTDGLAKTADDQVSIGWSTWHSNTWFAHGSAITSYDQWHHLGLAWGGSNDFEIWLDGILMSSNNIPGSVSQAWGSSGLGLGSAYNFALGEIHQRSSGNSTVSGITFADIEIWDEYRAQGGTSTIPVPMALPLFSTALIFLWGTKRRGEPKKIS